MKIAEFCQALDERLAAEADADRRLRLLTTALQQAFKIKDDEFAILRLDPEFKDLGFLWPKKLVKSGRVPINARDSLVARTAREGKPLLDNRFTNTRHAMIFEKIPLGSAPANEAKPAALPIQKIMSVPVPHAGALLGVMQLCRKGEDPDTAGPDFTAAELEAFAAIANAVRSHIPW